MNLPQCVHIHVHVHESESLFPPKHIYLQPDVIQNMTEFKRSLPLFPLVKPHINFMAAKLWRIWLGEELEVDQSCVTSVGFHNEQTS